MLILCLCPEQYHWKLIPGYAAAFRKLGINFFCTGDKFPFDEPLDEILKVCPEPPSWIFHFESGLPLLPQGLEKSEIPTVCFHPDTYAFTRKRVRWSYLFDHVAVFHPGYEKIFRKAGHPGAFVLPHAIRRELYDGPELERQYEIGWVGQVSGPHYLRRTEWLPKLASSFQTNDWSRTYTLAEVAEVYRRSRIVVNIGRDDYPRDANMRVFEAMASGALLFTSLPTELSELGFEQGVHFIGYRHEREIIPLVKKYLQDEQSRRRIAEAGRAIVIKEYTYDQRAAQLLELLTQAEMKRLAPARFWLESRARLMALDFYASHGVIPCASAQFRRIAGHGFRETIQGAALLLRARFKHRGSASQNSL
jgi:Glycosyl transferases group 1